MSLNLKGGDIMDTKKEQIHIVLGGSGAIGSAVIKELKSKNLSVKAIERTKKVQGVETINADLLDYEDFKNAAKEASHIYLCVGLPYNSKIWERDWPKIMKNAIQVCKENSAKLIFFDNIYMYGPAPLDVPFTEDHNQAPTTKKGLARKKTTDLLLNSIDKKEIKGVIGRSADFYGPGAVNSSFYIVFLENMLKNKNPQWVGKKDIKHTYAYTEDNAKALVMLALDEAAYGQVWHLPVAKPVTAAEVLDIFNKKLNKDFRISYVPRALLNFISLFIPVLNEAKEMMYQFDNEYIMSDQKFRTKFPEFKPNTYEDGIEKMINYFRE
jgi:nucleoside-diphosphate-sugar epimerase